jgi:tetratricopeptide (TPR) repeat protein
MKKQIPQHILDVDDERLVQMRQAEREHNAYRYAFQTLLRFFMFSPWHHTIINPFNLTPYFTEVPILLPFIDDNFLLETSRLFLRHANYIHAATYLRSWMHRNGQTEETLRMLAQCDKHLGENTERLQCLIELEKSNPDDMYIVQETGLCLINEKRYDEALKRFFHLEVKETSPRSSARAIAWCSMMTGNITRAQRYYQKLLDWQGGPSWEDLLNAGHCAWINGDPIQASALYNRYIALHQDSLTAFDNDYDTLIYLGVSEEDICLMRETIITHKTQ